MWAAGDAERERNRAYHYRESDKLRKMDKLDKLDKLEKLDLMDSTDRVKHLEAQMLSKIQAMDLEPKLLADEEVGSKPWTRRTITKPGPIKDRFSENQLHFPIDSITFEIPRTEIGSYNERVWYRSRPITGC